ncbi:MAG: DUF3823 domain-containing protein [Tannerellaceae bacterium]|jgi:hypothetical protein|nr:DUF3823 domain-containing protein [Tannerellaceae bacterium]
MKKYLIVCLLFGLFASCDKLDTYDEPKETLTGAVIDITTNKPIQTEQPNGYRLRLMELSWSDNPIPLYFWGKADGTFNNSKVFAGEYEITPVEGAFFSPAPQTVKIKGTVNVEFKVTPYLSVHADQITLANDQLLVKYRILRTQEGDKIYDSRVFVSTNPNVGFNVLIGSLSPLRDLRSIDDQTILQTTFEEQITGLEKGKTYYVRIGARTNNPSLRYNFSETTKIEN